MNQALNKYFYIIPLAIGFFTPILPLLLIYFFSGTSVLDSLTLIVNSLLISGDSFIWICTFNTIPFMALQVLILSFNKTHSVNDSYVLLLSGLLALLAFMIPSYFAFMFPSYFVFWNVNSMTSTVAPLFISIVSSIPMLAGYLIGRVILVIKKKYGHNRK